MGGNKKTSDAFASGKVFVSDSDDFDNYYESPQEASLGGLDYSNAQQNMPRGEHPPTQ